jgi:hypothetical protein
VSFSLHYTQSRRKEAFLAALFHTDLCLFLYSPINELADNEINVFPEFSYIRFSKAKIIFLYFSVLIYSMAAQALHRRGVQ